MGEQRADHSFSGGRLGTSGVRRSTNDSVADTETKAVKRRLMIASLMILVAAGSHFAVLAKDPTREVLGLRLGMSEQSARNRLTKIATWQKPDRKKRLEVWVLKGDPTYRFLIVKFKESQLIFVQAVVNETAHVRYDELGSLAQAVNRSDGHTHTYEWKVKPRAKQAGYLLIARGTNSEFVTSYSLYIIP
jgi:hypothetical protein